MKSEPAEIICADGERLTGHFFQAAPAPDGLPVLICPATGVKQFFYLRFAHWLAQQGHDVLVFDYRGIGLSLHGKLKDSKATLTEWGQLDQVAALDWLLARTGAPKIVLIGHSAGGQMAGLLPNHNRIERLVGVAASTGWFKYMTVPFRYKAQSGLQYLIPLAIRFLGYAPCSKLGLGEDLPSGVALQWGQWCQAGGYATNAIKAIDSQEKLDFHADIRFPVTSFYATDDEIANAATVADLLRTYPNAVRKAVMVTPAQVGLKSIGHLDWFRKSHQAVWPMLANAVRGRGDD